MSRRWLSVRGLAAFYVVAAAGYAQTLPPIQRVEIGAQQEIRVNGAPFFPIMGWLQSSENLPLVKQCGFNTMAGFYADTPEKMAGIVPYLDELRKVGLYGVMPYDSRVKGHPALLGYIHDDEPDMDEMVSDAVVEPGPGLKIGRPLWGMIDGNTGNWVPLDPVENASFTIRLTQPVTVTSFAVTVTVYEGVSWIKELRFEGDGKEIARQQIDPQKKGPQRCVLEHPAAFRNLRVSVTQWERKANSWASVQEIEGFDAHGKNVLLSVPRRVPRTPPEEIVRRYRAVKEKDPSRPVFVTFTAAFIPAMGKWSETERQELYGSFARGADVVGFDIYPIYGWNRPEWIPLVHDGTSLLKKVAGGKPVYAFIETTKGSRWITPARQLDVTPEHIAAEAWSAICGGATAIAYFTHRWVPDFAEFGVPLENRAALKALNERIARLAPAILAPASARRISVSSGGVSVVWKATEEKKGVLTIFAVNNDGAFKEAKAVFSVPELNAGDTVVVVDENRSISAQGGSFEDAFAPMAVHIYQIPSGAR